MGQSSETVVGEPVVSVAGGWGELLKNTKKSLPQQLHCLYQHQFCSDCSGSSLGSDGFVISYELNHLELFFSWSTQKVSSGGKWVCLVV